MSIEFLKQQIVEVAKTSYNKGLTAGWGGNISARVDSEIVLITPHKKSLAFVSVDDLLLIDMKGTVLEGGGRVSTETKMHLSLYEEFEYNAIVHLHPPSVNAVVSSGVPISLSTYESSLTLGGTPPIVPQTGPTVTDTDSLVEAFKTSSIVILEKHGIVSAGDDLFEAYSYADVLEDAAQITIHKTTLNQGALVKEEPENNDTSGGIFQVFSQEHLKKLQDLINSDAEAQKLGKDTDLTVKYAIKQQEDGLIYNMHFVEGRLTMITNSDEDADFINLGKREIWIHVFNGRLDPFAATSQKKLRLIKGHIGDLSKWYAPFYRIFDLWKFAPVKELPNE